MANGQAFIKVVMLPNGTWDTVAKVITLTEEGYNELLEWSKMNGKEIIDSETVGDSKYI